MRNKLFAGVAFAALIIPGAAFAQSTGTVDFETGDIVVTGTAEKGVGGVEIPDTPKAKVQIDRELMLHQTPGQTVNDIINLVPGVSFTNNDPFGSLGGSFTIRGFDASRISQTIDGIPLNDSGNYALYTNQQPDPETLESVTVDLGSTDVDSPTASAVGGTINIRSRNPSDEMGAMVSASYGDIIARGQPDSRPFHRVFGMIDTGIFTSFGTKMWLSASMANNVSTFSNYGGVDKQQYNGKLYQPIGSNGDFISIGFNYNQNRNNFNGSPSSNLNYPLASPSDRFYTIGVPCTTAAATPGVQDKPNNCGTEFERRFNPSNTGNIRINSKFTLADGLTLTVDPSFQYVKANGGGTTKYAYEGTGPGGVLGDVGYPYQSFYFGRDLNGDGDTLDQVTLLQPSHTRTRRYGVIANLAYDLNDNNRIRVSYTYDRANHRQTGTTGYLYSNGNPVDVFPINNPILDANGFPIGKRDRQSYATLNQISGEYLGKFMDQNLIVRIGVRAPFFTRDLDQRCFTAAPDGTVNCVDPSQIAAFALAHPTYAPPQTRHYSYNKLLPNVGFTYRFTPAMSIYASYAQNISVPGTDNLYDSLYFTGNSARPNAETSDSFDGGLRYQSGMVQAQVGAFYTKYKNRLATAYNPDLDAYIDRNLGAVEKYGFDGSVSVRPSRHLLVYVFGSYLKSRIENDVLGGTCTAGNVTSNYYGCTTVGADYYYPTAGKRESGGPKYTYGTRIQGSFGGFELGFQIKRTGSRPLNDINTVFLPAYTVADLDARYSLAKFGLDKTYLQVNVTNLFDEVYIGSASGGITTNSTYVNIGPPRAIIGSLIVGF